MNKSLKTVKSSGAIPKKPVGREIKPKMNDECRYEAEDNLRTLRRAEEIRADKNKMKYVHHVATEHTKHIGKVLKKDK